MSSQPGAAIASTFDLSQLDWTLRGWHPWFWCNQISMEIGIALQPDVGPVPVVVPGSVQQALLTAGVLPDWTVGLNSRACEWVEHRHWSFETVLPDQLIATPGRKILHFDGLDGNGVLFVNGKRLLEFANAFIDYSVDITGVLVSEGNRVCVVFTDQPKSLGQVGYTSRIRDWKPRFNYVWDWCPRLVQIGIWDTASVQIVPEVMIVSASVYTTCLPDQHAGTVHVTALVERPASSIRIVVEDAGATIAEHKSPISDQASIELACPNISLWHPWEQGAQKLYLVRIEVLDGSNQVLDQAVRSVGFRQIQWNACESAPDGALPWVCCVNAKPLFLLGLNWVPIRPNFADVTEADYRHRLETARAMGVNVLRVWGGAVLEIHEFYRLCDELGLLVWQEFPLTSSGTDNWPPEEPALIADIRLIARSYIRRRQHHASLLQWCGGNELQSDLITGGPGCGKPVDMHHPMIAALGEEVARLDPTRRFLPSSASGPRFTADETDFGKGLHHDVHGPWEQTGTFDQWRKYWDNDDALFRSEVGVPSASPVDLLSHYAGDHILPADLTNPLWRHVSAWWIQWQKYLGEGGDPGNVERYVHWSQDRQAAALSYAVNACRRRFPQCGGIVLWMAHDCFPCPSNTAIIDYLGRPKPAAKALMRALIGQTFQPPAALENDRPLSLVELPRVARCLTTGLPLRIVIYGDSISEVDRTPNYFGGAETIENNWGTQLGKLIKDSLPEIQLVMLHFAVGGQNTYEALGRFDYLSAFEPDLVLIELGTNDCGWHPLPSDATGLAMKSLIEAIRVVNGADVMVLLPVGENPRYKNLVHMAETRWAIGEAARSARVPVVDIQPAMFNATANGDRWNEFHNGEQDCHPNDAGHRIWAQTVFAALGQLLISAYQNARAGEAPHLIADSLAETSAPMAGMTTI